jgi:hypothetical protein
VQDDLPVGLESVEAPFHDERALADAGMVLVATPTDRLASRRLWMRWST